MLRLEAYWPAIALFGLPLIWWWTRTQRTALSPARLRVAAGLRSAALVLLVGALMRPTLERPDARVSVVYALDISRSIAPGYLRDALEAIGSANRKAGAAAQDLRYVVFGDRARLVSRLEDVPAVAVKGETEAAGAGQAIDQRATNIESALSAALFGFVPRTEKHLVLITDGHQTQGDLWRALPRLRTEGVRVFSLPAPSTPGSDAWVDSMIVPDTLRQREPFALRVQVYARAPATVQVELRNELQRQVTQSQVAGSQTTQKQVAPGQSSSLLGSQSVPLHVGMNDVVFETQLTQRGRTQLSARLAGTPDHDVLTNTVWVQAPARVLYVEGGKAPEAARYLSGALRAQGLEVTQKNVEQFVADAQALRNHDAVILSDVPAQLIDARASAALESYVRDQGGGLVFIAGENTFGKAGFAKSAIERLLPVKFEGKRKRQDIDLVLLIDRSHSMRGRKLEIAKTAALSTLDLLDPHHRLAVVAFDARPHEVVPLAEVGGKRRAEDLILSMTASGQTNLYHALHYAHRLLEKSQAKIKHVIVLSDGVTAAPPGGESKPSPGEEQMEVIRKARADYLAQWRRDHPGQAIPGVDDLPPDPPPGTFEELITRFVEEKITLSTVSLGEKPNLELMANLAKWADGKSYVAGDDTEIPGLFVSEAQRLLGESLIEEPFRPVVKTTAVSMNGLDFAHGPELKGLVVSKPKRFAEVLLAGKRDLPLLAQTRYGLGKTVVFMSDAKDRWGVNWLNWSGYDQFWAQVVRDAARRDGGQEVNWRVTREGDDAQVTLTAYTPDGGYRNGLAPRVRIGDGDQTELLRLRPTSPGNYSGHISLPGPRPAPYLFELMAGGGLGQQEVARIESRELRYGDRDEYRVLPADQSLLRLLSEQTGGRFAPDMMDIYRHYGDGGTRSTPLWGALAAGALALYLLELFVRRSPWRLMPTPGDH